MLDASLVAELDQLLMLRKHRPRSVETEVATKRLFRRAAVIDRETRTPMYQSRRNAIAKIMTDAECIPRLKR